MDGKRNPNLEPSPAEAVEMEVEPNRSKHLRFQELPDDVVFYLMEVYAHYNKLFLTGIMENGQTFSIVANQSQRELYFCLKPDLQSTTNTPEYLDKVKKEIDLRIKDAKIDKFHGEFEVKTYLFEIDGVPRNERPYYKVRYSFKTESPSNPKPDEEGETYKFVFGTTYTPLELFIINTGIKGPSWVKIEKSYLKQSKGSVEGSLCAQVIDPELIEPIVDRVKPPSVRVMSISIKAAIPAQIKLKKLFNTNRVDEQHIYAISYTYCEDYVVDFKPIKYFTISRTFYLKQFKKMSGKDFIECQTQQQMLAQFQADLKKHDPDVIVCHDISRVIDPLILRLLRISEKNDKPRLGRLIFPHQVSKANQNQRVNSSIAGRLLVDTFIHSKDMIKSVDYELGTMASYIKPPRAFKGLSEEEIKNLLQENNTTQVIEYTRNEADVAFALMNHLEVLQITRQLSKICGIIWKRSLENQRAERNEYLIMHDCAKRKLIIPDKFRKEKITDQDEEVDKKKYQGGHVIPPSKGIYTEFILLLDFNSLYPSIIREYNICFSIIDRPKLPMSYYYKPNKTKKAKAQKMEEEGGKIEESEAEEVVPPPAEECIKSKWGFLPHLIDTIVERRKKCKKAMQNATAQKSTILDIQQKCYKLVANSIYGCLGFSVSRFYSQHLAALITRMGRRALLKARDIVQATGGVEVIYGDTDSLMIHPTHLRQEGEKEKLFELNNIASGLKKLINEEYRNLQIDIDGIFKPLILLMKKKYVANKLVNFDRILAGLDEVPRYNVEYKGIEVVRRDGFSLARDTLKGILEILMKNSQTEAYDIYEQIYGYIRKLNEQIPKMSYRQFLFSKQLNKSPKQYAKGETIPHVKVALDRMKRGEREQTLVHHTIYYVVCKAKDSSHDTLAKKCYDDRSYERSQKSLEGEEPLQIDYDYYKQELIKPIGRITIHMKEFDTERMLKQLNIEEAKRKPLRKFLEKEDEDGEIFNTQFSLHKKQDSSDKINQLLGQYTSKCGNKLKLAAKGLFLLRCPNCNENLTSPISNRIQLNIKLRVDEYYSNKHQCKCDKKYMLTPIFPCCKAAGRIRSKIPFELHDLIYVSKDLCEITLATLPDKQNTLRLCKLLQKLNQFLRTSDFEEVQGLKEIFRI